MNLQARCSKPQWIESDMAQLVVTGAEKGGQHGFDDDAVVDAASKCETPRVTPNSLGLVLTCDTPNAVMYYRWNSLPQPGVEWCGDG